MKLGCPKCGEIIRRTKKQVNQFNTKRGYPSYCDKTDKKVFCKPVVSIRRGLGLQKGSYTLHVYLDGTCKIFYDNPKAFRVTIKATAK